ncbi:hypothetical protein IWX49DRAFT_387279 [Phyllosticta citricarpa]|uniref:HMG box domain-containing protein n=1 Tax=Phyllosticta paracitricarpa TaxID=2016321 RepID=A0ABR1MTY4_9PEZI
MLKTESMVQRHPPTPPSGPSEQHYDLRQLAQQNANTSFKHDLDDSPYGHSQSYSVFGSPAPIMHQQHSGDPYLSPQYAINQYPEPPHDHRGDVGLGISIDDGYGTSSQTYYNEGQIYHQIPYMQQGIHSHTPPTPRSATASDAGRRTRSGTSAARTASPTSKPRPSKPKKKPENKTKVKTPKLTAPLSVLTKDYDEIPVKNMEEWVNRSEEVRREEVAKRHGYITRPMNSFMLYRSAYADRTKIWCLQNNHQVVSSVSGESWPMEPPEIREHYNELARIERLNHQKAHPEYKFCPSKSASTARKRKGFHSDDEAGSQASDVDDPDAEWAPSRRVRVDRTRRQPAFDDHNFGPNDHGINKSSWEATNEGRPLPMALGSNDLGHNQYYQTSVQPHGASGVEDVRLHRMEHASNNFRATGYPRHFAAHQQPQMQQHQQLLQPQHMVSQSVLGLPGGGQHHDLLQMSFGSGSGNVAGTPGPHDPAQVDPMLLAYASTTEHPFAHDDGTGFHTALYGTDDDIAGYVGDATGTLHAGASGTNGGARSADWQVDSVLMPLESGSEFDKWVDEATQGN